MKKSPHSLPRRLFIPIFAVIAFLQQSCTSDGGIEKPAAAPPNPNDATVYQFTMNRIDGTPQKLDTYRGKVLLIVNTASKCGHTPQYKDLQALYEKINTNPQSPTLEILGFPANNFLKQEPGSNAEIATFCQKNYGVSFPMFEKISVAKENIHPLYQFLTQKKYNQTLDTEVSWNFQKFLISKSGKLLATFAPTTSVNSPEVQTALAKALAE